jgi:flavin-dependent dehydrogenase
MRHFDVVVLGAGPAGASTALGLRKSHPHLSVVMVEACDFHAMRPAEILSREAIPILQQLDVLDFFLEQNHPQLAAAPCPIDGSTAPYDLYAGVLDDGGWYLDRARFDSMLAGYAAASGASFIRATMVDVKCLADNSWQIVAQSPLKSHTLNASFVVDATGRSARFATEIGVPQFAHDAMVGVARVLNLENAEQLRYLPLIEPFEHGWWYSALTADKRLAVVAMTDADISKQQQFTDIASWADHLREAPLTQERVAGLKGDGDLSVRVAHTRNLQSCCDKTWLAVGDAAASVDPMASQGISRALHFGIHASDAIGGHFQSEESSLDNSEALVQMEFQNNLSLLATIYRSESRWEHAPFWLRRKATPEGGTNLNTDRKSMPFSSNATNGIAKTGVRATNKIEVARIT